MNLADYQRALVRASMELEPRTSDLEALGDVEKGRMYRSMIRSRLIGMARVAFRGAEELVGEPAFAASFARFLADVSPRSPLLRDVIADFGEFACSDAMLCEGAPALGDMLAFELAKWRAAYVHAPRLAAGEGNVGEFDFEAVPVLNPVLTCLALEHAVHEPARRHTPTRLFVYRPAALDQVRWYATDAYFYALVRHVLAVHEPFVVSVRQVAEAQGIALDQALIEQLSTSVTLALSRHVFLGSERETSRP